MLRAAAAAVLRTATPAAAARRHLAASARALAPRRYTEDHEWAETVGDTTTIGVSDYAQDSLGDIVYVELPEPGTELQQKEQMGAIESVKAASDIYMPVSGVVLEVNEALKDKPGMVNRDPYGEGWLLKIKASKPAEMEGLMDQEAYDSMVADA